MKNIRTETIRNEYQPLAVIDRAIIELLISKLINNTYK